MTELRIHANGKVEIIHDVEPSPTYSHWCNDGTHFTAYTIDEAIFKEKASKIIIKEIKEIQNEINKLNVRKKKFERAYLKIKESE